MPIINKQQYPVARLDAPKAMCYLVDKLVHFNAPGSTKFEESPCNNHRRKPHTLKKKLLNQLQQITAHTLIIVATIR